MKIVLVHTARPIGNSIHHWIYLPELACVIFSTLVPLFNGVELYIFSCEMIIYFWHNEEW